MSLETLKQQIGATIDASQDEALLQDVMNMLLQHSFNETNINDTDLTQLCMITSENHLHMPGIGKMMKGGIHF